MTDDREIANLISRLDAESVPERNRAVDALVEIGSPAVTLLMQAVLSDSYILRAYALMALGRIEDWRVVSPLLHALDDKKMEVKWTASEALRGIRGGFAVMPLLQCLKDTNRNDLRRLAMEMLQNIGDVHTIPRKVLSTAGLNSQQRFKTLESLQKEGIANVRSPRYNIPKFCQQMLSDEDPSVCKGAQEVLNYLTLGRPLERDPSSDAEVLLRPVIRSNTPTEPSKLLRASEAPTEEPKRKGLLGRLFKRG